jgi:hypothetical protein
LAIVSARELNLSLPDENQAISGAMINAKPQMTNGK